MAANSQAFSLSSGSLMASAMAADNLAMAAYLAGISLIPVRSADRDQEHQESHRPHAGAAEASSSQTGTSVCTSVDFK